MTQKNCNTPPPPSEGNLRLSLWGKRNIPLWLPNATGISLASSSALTTPAAFPAPAQAWMPQQGALKGRAAVCLSHSPSAGRLGPSWVGKEGLRRSPSSICQLSTAQEGGLFSDAHEGAVQLSIGLDTWWWRGEQECSELLPSKASNGESMTVAKVN